MKFIKRKYYEFRIRLAQDNIDFLRGLHNATEEQLSNNISYIRNSAIKEYYTKLLSVVNY